jgi:rod shape determining protein RodA
MRKRTDTGIIIAVSILSFIGLGMIYSTAGTALFTRQLIWFGIAVVVAVLFSRISPRIWLNLAPYCYALGIILLVMVIFMGSGYPKRWYRFGASSIQPSEFAKFGTILLLASVCASKKSLTKFTDIIVPLIIIIMPAALIFIEPDLGAAQIFFPILLVMLYWTGMPFLKIFIVFSPLVSAAASFNIYIWAVYFAGLAALLYFNRKLGDFVYGITGNFLAGLTMPIVWNSLKQYQQERIISFFSPWVDPRGMSWQVIQSKIAIGSGQLIGKGFLSGTQKKLEFLPERHTDFIFSCLGEEFGLIGIIVTVAIFIYLLYRLLTLAKETKNRFSSICVIGFLAWFGYQTFLNIGMTMGLLPITGVPLPFVSYGGSSLLACFMAIGVCCAISKSRFNY